jgi:hypothetical protein
MRACKRTPAGRSAPAFLGDQLPIASMRCRWISPAAGGPARPPSKWRNCDRWKDARVSRSTASALALLRRACNDPGVAIDVGGQDMALPARLERHAMVASSLAALGDGELAALMDAAPALGSGIGGTRSLRE